MVYFLESIEYFVESSVREYIFKSVAKFIDAATVKKSSCFFFEFLCNGFGKTVVIILLKGMTDSNPRAT